ncbi:hypothetical protein INR49_011996 [Caranx melampygus]|nr:hypothetical protein INR49_011996 [Caranx melampygus]
MCGNNMSAPLPAIVPAARKATAAAWLGRSLCRNQDTTCEYICPHAPTMPVSLNMRMSMPSWFDIYGLSPDADEDESGIKRAQSLDRPGSEEWNTITQNYLGWIFTGWSIVSLHSSDNSAKLAGVVALSCWLPLRKSFPQASANSANKDMHVLQCHGDADPLVPFVFGSQTAEKMKSLINPANVTFKSYRGLPHSACPEEMVDIKRFIEKQLPPITGLPTGTQNSFVVGRMRHFEKLSVWQWRVYGSGGGSSRLFSRSVYAASQNIMFSSLNSVLRNCLKQPRPAALFITFSNDIVQERASSRVGFGLQNRGLAECRTTSLS